MTEKVRPCPPLAATRGLSAATQGQKEDPVVLGIDGPAPTTSGNLFHTMLVYGSAEEFHAISMGAREFLRLMRKRVR